MKDTKEQVAFLDGGSIVDIEIKDDRTYLTFRHSYGIGVFKVELDKCVLEDKSEKELFKSWVKITKLMNDLTGVFNEMRGR